MNITSKKCKLLTALFLVSAHAHAEVVVVAEPSPIALLILGVLAVWLTSRRVNLRKSEKQRSFAKNR